MGDVPSYWYDPDRFFHRVALRLSEIQPSMGGEGRYIYLTLDKAMDAVGMKELEAYALLRQNTVA